MQLWTGKKSGSRSKNEGQTHSRSESGYHIWVQDAQNRSGQRWSNCWTQMHTGKAHRLTRWVPTRAVSPRGGLLTPHMPGITRSPEAACLGRGPRFWIANVLPGYSYADGLQIILSGAERTRHTQEDLAPQLSVLASDGNNPLGSVITSRYQGHIPRQINSEELRAEVRHQNPPAPRPSFLEVSLTNKNCIYLRCK